MARVPVREWQTQREGEGRRALGPSVDTTSELPAIPLVVWEGWNLAVGWMHLKTWRMKCLETLEPFTNIPGVGGRVASRDFRIPLFAAQRACFPVNQWWKDFLFDILILWSACYVSFILTFLVDFFSQKPEDLSACARRGLLLLCVWVAEGASAGIAPGLATLELAVVCFNLYDSVLNITVLLIQLHCVEKRLKNLHIRVFSGREK